MGINGCEIGMFLTEVACSCFDLPWTFFMIMPNTPYVHTHTIYSSRFAKKVLT